MNETEINLANRYRGFYTKIALKSIYGIYDSHNGTNNSASCWCSSTDRKNKSHQFYEWFDAKLLENDDKAEN